MEQHNTMVRLTNGTEFSFSRPGAGRQNSLLVDTVELFGSNYAPRAHILHLQDQANGISIHEAARLEEVGIPELPVDLLPDIVLFQPEKQYLFLIAVSTLRGPFTTQRKQDLERHIVISPIRRIFVSTFFEHEDYQHVISHIAWRSYVWLAHIPDHMIAHW